jgi:type 1 glutamine amidotransferase
MTHARSRKSFVAAVALACLSCGTELDRSVAGRDENPDGSAQAADAEPDIARAEVGRPDVGQADVRQVDVAQTDVARADVAPGAADAHPSAADAAAAVDGSADGALNRPIVVFTRTTGFRHDSIEPAAMALKTALTPFGVAVETRDDVNLFAPTELGRYGAVVLLSTTGTPLGQPGTDAIAALSEFVRAGGGLIGVHAATSTDYGAASTYAQLLGGNFVDHPGGVRASTCYVAGTHESVARLPAMFSVQDEIYTFDFLATTNVVVLRCSSVDGTIRLPIAWYRLEGAGRVFHTALGHGTEEWSVGGVLVRDHVVPGILWVLGR